MVNVKINSGRIFCDFLKVDSNNKIISTEKYELVSADTDEGTGLYTRIGDFGQHTFTYDNGDNDDVFAAKLFNAFPKYVRNELNSVSTKSDLAKFQGYNSEILNYQATSDGAIVSFVIPLKFRQTIAEVGYKKDSVIFSSTVRVNYKYDEEENIENATVSIHGYGWSNNVIYNMEATPINSFNDLAKFKYTTVERACLNNEGGRIITDRNRCEDFDYFLSTSYDFIPYFVSQKGNVTFKIENTVNDLVKYNASKNKDLTYKITVTNTGNASSSDNVITTNVAKEVTVNEKGISDSGVYNKKDHTITWNVDLIDAGEVLSVTYEAVAPNDADGKELIGNSSIVSAQVTKEVYSNFTVVTLDKVIEVVKNPNTGTMIYLANTNVGISVDLLMNILLLCAVLLIALKMILKKIKIKRYQDS